jgi:putative hemolysin
MEIRHFILSVLISLFAVAIVHADFACPMYQADEVRCQGKGLILESWKEAGGCKYCFIPNYNACYDFTAFRNKHKLSDVVAVEAELRKFAKEKRCYIYFNPEAKIGCSQPGDVIRIEKTIAELGLK